MIIKNLEIKKVVFRGLGLGFDEDGAIFVDNAYPGDILDVETFRSKGKTRFARINKVIEPAEIRQQATCEAFGTCGGCDWLDIDYSAQLHLKQEIMEEVLGNMGTIDPIIGSDTPEHYRNKSFMPVSQIDDKPIIGIFQKRSHDVIEHSDCKIQPKIYDEIAAEFIQYAIASKLKVYNEKNQKGTLRHLGFRRSEANGEIILVLVTRSRKLPFTNQLINRMKEKFPQVVGIIQNINPTNGNVILGDSEKILFGQDYLTEKIEHVSFKLNYRSFFQINHSTTTKLYDYIKAQIGADETVMDAYSGVGTIGIFLAEQAKKVIGVESVETAVEDAKKNVELNNLDNCFYQVGLVEDKLAEICSNETLDTIIFDPPRKGLEPKIIAVLAENPVKKIIYVSCNPMTQKRDLELLLQVGYKIEKIQPFDMFPQTWHIENIVVLTK